MNDSFLFMLFKLMKLKLSAEQKPVKLLWVANLSLVKPELKRVSLTLICAKGVPCNQSVLADKRVSILGNDRMIGLIGSGEFKSIYVDNELFSSVVSMLKADRYYYAIYVIDEVIKKYFDQDFQIIELKKLSINHVIHKKHIGLLPQIQEKIHAKLPEFNRKRLANNNNFKQPPRSAQSNH